MPQRAATNRSGALPALALGLLISLIAGAWKSVYANVDLQGLGEPVVIEDGDSFDYDFKIRASIRPNTVPTLDVEQIDGTYRVTWHTHTQKKEDEPATDLLPLEARASNEIALELAE